jgi:hypothetical protein
MWQNHVKTIYLLIFAVLEIELRTLNMVGTSSSPKAITPTLKLIFNYTFICFII